MKFLILSLATFYFAFWQIDIIGQLLFRKHSIFENKHNSPAFAGDYIFVPGKLLLQILQRYAVAFQLKFFPFQTIGSDLVQILKISMFLFISSSGPAIIVDATGPNLMLSFSAL